MKHRVKKEDSFKIIGIETSIYPSKGDEDTIIPELWHKFVAENIIDQIPHKMSFDMIALYSKYQREGEKPVGCRDEIGSYSYLIGCKVDNLAKIPLGLTGHEVPAAQYAVYITEGNNFPATLGHVWKTIWTDEKTEFKRTFQYDFEVYGAAFQGPEKTVEVYVGIE